MINLADITLGETLHRKSGGDITEDAPLPVKQPGVIVKRFTFENRVTLVSEEQFYIINDEKIKGSEIRGSFRADTFDDNNNYELIVIVESDIDIIYRKEIDILDVSDISRSYFYFNFNDISGAKLSLRLENKSGEEKEISPYAEVIL